MDIQIYKQCSVCKEQARIHRVQWVEKRKLSTLYKCTCCGFTFTYHKHIKGAN